MSKVSVSITTNNTKKALNARSLLTPMVTPTTVSSIIVDLGDNNTLRVRSRWIKALKLGPLTYSRGKFLKRLIGKVTFLLSTVKLYNSKILMDIRKAKDKIPLLMILKKVLISIQWRTARELEVTSKLPVYTWIPSSIYIGSPDSTFKELHRSFLSSAQVSDSRKDLVLRRSHVCQLLYTLDRMRIKEKSPWDLDWTQFNRVLDEASKNPILAPQDCKDMEEPPLVARNLKWFKDPKVQTEYFCKVSCYPHYRCGAGHYSDPEFEPKRKRVKKKRRR